MSEARPIPRRRVRRLGFSIVEMVVGMAVTVILLLAVLQLFESNTKVARVQTDVSDMQQSLRVARREMTRMVRMAGRGSMPAALGTAPMVLDDSGTLGERFVSPALEVRNNVGVGGSSAAVAPGLPNSPTAATGSDILTVRGVLSTTLYHVNSTDSATISFFDIDGLPTANPAQAAIGQVVVSDPGPAGDPQDLVWLTNSINAGVAEAIVLVSPLDDRVYAVVELDPASSIVGANQVTVAFFVQGGTRSEYSDLYASGGGTAPVLPTALRSVAYLGIVEEYRFYVRDDGAVRSLSMARMFPGSQVPYANVLANAQSDIADNIIDFQVALGFDSDLGAALVDRDGDGRADQNDLVLTETADGTNDDWLFNAPAGDNSVAQTWIGPWDDDPVTAAPRRPDFFYVRINTVAQTQRLERNYTAPVVQPIEDGANPINTDADRTRRRRLHQTIIDLRNI